MANSDGDKANNVILDVEHQQRPVRIVSLLPSITEVLSSLGVADQIVGITHECDFPPQALQGARVVTTSEIQPHKMTQTEIHKAVCGSLLNGHSLYGMNADALRSVRPDIVFTQSLCDVCAVSYPVVLDTCARVMAGPPAGQETELCPKVISMEPTDLKEVLKTFHVAGKALGTEEQASSVVTKLQQGFEKIRRATENIEMRPKVAFMEWHDPIFSGGHWIPDMVELAGGKYEMCASGSRSSPIENEEFVEMDPDVVLIGPCGFSLERALRDTIALHKQNNWFRNMRAVKEGRVFALDGNSYFARPGPRLLQGCGVMAACIHGEEVAKALGEELAPSLGYCRVTADMYD